jgi:hypothetical protein
MFGRTFNRRLLSEFYAACHHAATHEPYERLPRNFRMTRERCASAV